MSVMTKEEKRQLFLSVKDAWPEITANFAEKGVTRATPANVWQKVYDECRSKGHAWTNGRDSKWLSGNKWPGIVKEVKGRAGKNRKTGSGGDTKLSELDEMVLNIIVKDGAGVKGLDVPDNGEGNSAEADFLAKSLVALASQPVVLNFVPKTHPAESQLGSLTPMSAFKLPRKKRALQPSKDQSFGDDEEDDDFKRKKHQWLDGMLHRNEQQRIISEMKIQRLQKELADANGVNKPTKEVITYDEFGYAMNHI